MNRSPILEALGLLDADAAFYRAALQAQRIAMQTGTPLAIWRDGHTVLVPPEQITLPPAPTPSPSPPRTA